MLCKRKRLLFFQFIFLKFSVDDVFEIKKTEITWGMLGIERYSRFLFVGQNLNSNNLSKILI